MISVGASNHMYLPLVGCTQEALQYFPWRKDSRGPEWPQDLQLATSVTGATTALGTMVMLGLASVLGLLVPLPAVWLFESAETERLIKWSNSPCYDLLWWCFSICACYLYLPAIFVWWSVVDWGTAVWLEGLFCSGQWLLFGVVVWGWESVSPSSFSLGPASVTISKVPNSVIRNCEKT